MRPMNYLDAAEKLLTRAANNTFLSEPVVPGSSKFRDMVFMAAVFALQQDIRAGRVFISDPAYAEILHEYMEYAHKTSSLKEKDSQ